MFGEYLDGFRELAEARMDESSTAVVRRLIGRDDQNEMTGEEAPEWEVIYTGPFRLGGANSGSSGTRTEKVADVELQVATRVAHFPASATTVADNDLIEITDGENTGLVLRIIEAAWADQQTARRFPVVTTDRPTEWEV